MGVGNERGREIFTEAGAIIPGHFRLKSGKDGVEYLAKDLVWKNNPEGARELCKGIVDDFRHLWLDTIVGPESGAIPYADCVAEILSEMLGRPVASVHALKTSDDNFRFRKEDLPHIVNKVVLVVEDVLTTGGSCQKVVKLVRSHFGIVGGVAGVWKRGTDEEVNKHTLGGVNEFTAQVDEEIPSYKPSKETCPGCREEIPYDMKLGHGKTLVGKHPLAIAA